MRICLLTPTFFPRVGGTEVVTDMLAKHFNAIGHETVVLVMRRKQKIDVPYDVHWTGRPLGWRWFPGRFVPKIKSLHKQYQFDILACNYGWPTGYAACLAAKKLNLPTVITSHGGDLFYAGINRQHKRVWTRTVSAYHQADGLTAISEYTEKMIREVYPNAPMLKRIPNGVDVQELHKPADRPADFDCQKPFILFLGNLKQQKGIDIALLSIKKIQEKLNEMQVVIVGGGRDYEKYNRMIHDLNLQDNVTMLGPRTGNDKTWLMQNCRYGLMPSREEGHPIVGLEFLAVGKPVICTTISAFDGLFESGVNGLCVEPDNIDQLADALVKMLTMDLHAMSQHSLSRIGNYDWSSIALTYIDFYRQLICNYKYKTTGQP